MCDIFKRTSSVGIWVIVGVAKDVASGPKTSMNLLYVQKLLAFLALSIDANC